MRLYELNRFSHILYTTILFLYRTQVVSFFTCVTNWLAHWLTHFCMWDLNEVTLAAEDAKLKLSDVVIIADIYAEEGVDDGLIEFL